MRVDFVDGDAMKATEEYDCKDTSRGVFKAYAVFLILTFIEGTPFIESQQHAKYKNTAYTEIIHLLTWE